MFGLALGFQIGFVVPDCVVASKGCAQWIICGWGALREIGPILMHLEPIGKTRFCRQGLSVQPSTICRECLLQGLCHYHSLLVEVSLVLYQSLNFALVEV